MAIVMTHLREVMFDDMTLIKLNAGESIEDVIARLEAAGIVVNVF